MSPTLRLLGIAGSLRAQSVNRRLLRAAIELAPEGVRVEDHPIADIPLYNGDLDVDGGPEPVRQLKEAIAAADGLLLVSPEYNYGVPGVLKNALDWASRPAYRSVLAHKPVAIAGASGSAVGTARGQGQLKQVLLGTISEVFPYPEVLVARASEKFDAEGRLVDEATRDALASFLLAYVEHLRRRSG
jgi:chromate reductase